MKPTSRSVVIAMLCAAAVTGQFVGGKATRDALFLTTLGFQTLPTMLIAASLCSILFVAAHARWAAKIAPSQLIQAMFATSGVLFLCEWIVRFRAPGATAVLLFLHTSAMGPLLTSGFWLIATERFDPRTAKWRFGQITGAATVGGLVGALLSERVAATLGAPAMLLVLGGLQFLTAWLFSQFATHAPSANDERADWAGPALHTSNARSGVRVIAEAPHLQLLAMLVLLGSTAAALLDYLFKARAIEAVGAGDELLRFFALYYAAISLVTFMLQVVSSRMALERFGVAMTTSTPSIALLAGSIGGVLAPGFASVAAARAGESIFRGSWFRAGYELFYTPIPAEEKRAVKSIVDVGADRLGDAVGGGLVRVAALVAPAAQASAILWMAICSSALAILAASRLNQWYVRTLGTSLVSQAPGVGRSDVDGHLTRQMVIRVRSSNNRSAMLERPDDIDDARALVAVRGQFDNRRRGYSRSTELHANEEAGPVAREHRERAIAVLSRDEGLSAALVPHAIPLLSGPFSDYALFALRKVAEERIGLLTDGLVDPNHDSAIRRQLARVFSICVSQRAADGLLLALDDERFDVRVQAAKSLAAVLARNPRVRVDRERVLEVVLREVAAGRPVWESQRQFERDSNGSVNDFVRDRAAQSLAHTFTLLSLVLPSQPLQIAFQSLHSENGRLRGTALEYLEGVLPAEIRQQVWPFLVQRDLNRPPQPQDDVIASLLRNSSSVTVAS
jgi:hypothetical protein